MQVSSDRVFTLKAAISRYSWCSESWARALCGLDILTDAIKNISEGESHMYTEEPKYMVALPTCGRRFRCLLVLLSEVSASAEQNRKKDTAELEQNGLNHGTRCSSQVFAAIATVLGRVCS